MAVSSIPSGVLAPTLKLATDAALLPRGLKSLADVAPAERGAFIAEVAAQTPSMPKAAVREALLTAWVGMAEAGRTASRDQRLAQGDVAGGHGHRPSHKGGGVFSPIGIAIMKGTVGTSPTSTITAEALSSSAKARTDRPGIYPPRVLVPPGQLAWNTPAPGYDPPRFVADVVLKNEGVWADSDDQRSRGGRFQSYTGPVKLDDDGRPQNPQGRTGVAGRGLLGRWGANFAADPLITRVDPETKLVQLIVIQRKDTGAWALPGGMVDPGEDASETARREFREEAGVDLDMSDGRTVFRGLVDDPRNTDHAWMETTVKHKHLDDATARKMELKAGDDASAVQWLPLDKAGVDQMYASHGSFVRAALKEMLEDPQLPAAARAQLQAIVG